MYVADGRNNCIHVFSVEGKFRRIFSGPVEPQSIAIDTNDIVYVSESYKNRVSVFTSKGQFITSFEKKRGHFIPYGVCVDSDGVVYVCDHFNNCIRLF